MRLPRESNQGRRRAFVSPSKWAFSLDPGFHISVLQTNASLGFFSRSNYTGVATLMMRVEKSLGKRPHCLHDKLDSSGCVCNKDQVELVGISVEEVKKVQTCIFDSRRRLL
jgi:hypothetical protein